MINLNLENFSGFVKNGGKVAVQSDQHLYHSKDFIYASRGFKNEIDHKEAILSDWAKHLSDNDILISNGDFALNADSKDVESLVSMIPCRTLFLLGNHASGIKQMYKKNLPETEFILGVKQEIFPVEIESGKYLMGDQYTFSYKKQNYLCSHFAPLTWEKMAKGVVALVGHSHGNLDKINKKDLGFGKVFDCGVDNALKYVGRTFFWLDEINEILKEKKIKIWDHHG